MEQSIQQGDGSGGNKRQIIHVIKLLKFIVLEIGLFVFDLGSDLYSSIKFGTEGHEDWAVATALCMLLPAVPEVFQFFKAKVVKYRGEECRDSQLTCLALLVFWMWSSPVLLVWFTTHNFYKV